MILAEMTSPEVDALPRDIVVLMPVASCEQHSLHLPLFTDSLIGQEVARRVHERCPDDVLVLPMQWLGYSQHHIRYPGTISAISETHLLLMMDIVASMVGHGFKKILIQNSHGGNGAPISVLLQRLMERYSDSGAEFYTRWAWASGGILDEIRELGGAGSGHAGETETCMIMAINPSLVRTDRLDPDGERDGMRVEGMSSYHRVDQRTRHGGVGDPRPATAEKGERMLDASADEIAGQIKQNPCVATIRLICTPYILSKMQSFDFQSSARVVFGENTLDQLGDLTKELGGSRVLLVTDPGIIRAGIPERALNSLKAASLDAFVFDGVAENPTSRHVANGVRFAKEQGGIDLLIGLGGGSAMDCAKGINFILTNGGRMEDYWGVDKATKPMLPSIGIPTTAGTGSEAQSFALIAQEGTHLKMACGDKKARFRTVILDPVLTTTTSQGVTAATGIDAISHAVESYVSTRRNPISQMFAKEAWWLLEKSFEIVVGDPENIEARSRMLLGAHLAGAAIENSMLGAAHACANPLTARYNITHGIAVGLMLPSVIRFNAQVVSTLYQELYPSSLHERVSKLKAVAGLPERLRDFGIQSEDLPQLAEEAAEQWTGKFNPRQLSEVELLELYEASY